MLKSMILLSRFIVQIKVGSLVFTPGHVQLELPTERDTTPNVLSALEADLSVITEVTQDDWHNFTTHSTNNSSTLMSPTPASLEVQPVVSPDEELNNKYYRVLVPLCLILTGTAILATFGFIMWFKKNNRRSEDECSHHLTQESRESSQYSVYTTTSLPPLPIASVFGPDRVTGINFNSLSFFQI